MYLLFVFVNALIFKKYEKVLHFLLPLIICSSIYLSYISIFSDNFAVYSNLRQQMYSWNKVHMPNIDKKEYALYLDDGCGAYVLGNRSWLDEYYPLPIQRITEGSKYENLECHTRALTKALRYDGKYVVVFADWIFGADKKRNKALQEKICTEYESYGEIAAYSVPVNIFDPYTGNTIKYYTLYKRK